MYYETTTGTSTEFLVRLTVRTVYGRRLCTFFTIQYPVLVGSVQYIPVPVLVWTSLPVDGTGKVQCT